jgi:hypothetical protein
MKNLISSLAAGVWIGGLVFVALDYSLGIPSVKFSYTTNECIEVENYQTVLFGTTTYSCENMPTKFNHVWVQ